jgi:hypothetical protein
MEKRAEFLIDYASEHGPVSVRGLYYQAEVAHLPGIDKAENCYEKVQRQVLSLRRQGRLSYEDISDATRWMRKPASFDSPQEAMRAWSASYRRNLWRDADASVEVWIEKDALAGVIAPVTREYDVSLAVTRGYSSETFAFNAIYAHEYDERPLFVYYLGDFDRSGRDAASSLEEKLMRFGREFGVTVYFEQIGVTLQQVREMKLPTREPKRKSEADKKWPHDFACELDAMPPDMLRLLVEAAINKHLPQDQFRILKVYEDNEREFLMGRAASFERAIKRRAPPRGAKSRGAQK